MTPPHAVLAALIFAAGSCVQGAVGFGVNLLAAPLLLLISPRLVPGPVIVASGLLNLLVMRSHPSAMVDPTVRVAIVGQVVGALLAGAVLASLPTDALSMLFAVLVLVGVLLSSIGIRLRDNKVDLAGAGAASGFMGTVSGIGGPPIALAYIGLRPHQLRATLSRFFLAGNLIAVPILMAAGKLGRDELVPILVLLPGAVAGFLASPALARHLDTRTAKPIILGLSTIAALAVMLRTLS